MKPEWQCRFPLRESCGPDDPAQRQAWREQRHSFFFKVCVVFFIAGVAAVCAFFFSGSGVSPRRVFHFTLGIGAILFVCFLILRRLFGPLHYLMRGVREIAAGNLEFQFPTWRHGEFRYLAEHFNLMARHIKEMVQSKSQLLRDVSHELRSPLTRLKLALEMMPRNKYRASMLQDVAEMETMLTEILETEKLRSDHGKLNRVPLDVAAIAAELAKKYKARKPGVKLLGYPQRLRLNADEGRVRTVLQNVLENALKYSAHQKKPVELFLQSQNREVLIVVRDFGVGVAAAEQEKVFAPFYRIDKSRTKETGGYGLGLSLCREIMQAHGGRIELQSEPGKGTDVILRFPTEKEAPINSKM